MATSSAEGTRRETCGSAWTPVLKRVMKTGRPRTGAVNQVLGQWDPADFINGEGRGRCSAIPSGLSTDGSTTSLILLVESQSQSQVVSVCPGGLYGVAVGSTASEARTGFLSLSVGTGVSAASDGTIDPNCPNRVYTSTAVDSFAAVITVPCDFTSSLTVDVVTASQTSSFPEFVSKRTWPVGSNCPNTCRGVSPSPPPGNSGGSSDKNAGAIAGGIIGGILGVALIAAIVIYCICKKKRNTTNNQAALPMSVQHGKPADMQYAAAWVPPPPAVHYMYPPQPPPTVPATTGGYSYVAPTVAPTTVSSVGNVTTAKATSVPSSTGNDPLNSSDMSGMQLEVDGFKAGDPFLRGTAKEYTWTNYTAGPDTFRVEAGLTDVANDQLLQYVGRQNRAFSPVVQLSSAEVKQSIQLLQSEGLLGKGGTAVVFKARWPDRFGPNGLVAVKVLKDPYETDMLDPVKQAFEFEAKVLAKVNHPNVVKMYGFCMEFPTICLILELLPTSLKDCIETTGPLASAASMSTAPSGGLEGPQKTGASMCSVLSGVTGPCTRMNLKSTLEIGTGVAAGLAYLHAKPLSVGGPTAATVSDFTHATAACVAALTEVAEQPVAVEVEGDEEQDTVGALTSRIVHRDLKPHNILINSAGTVKISDFGLAREHDHTTVSTIHAGAGTVRYMAPELLIAGKTGQGKGAVTSKVDIYSMGIMLWQMLAGRVPYENFNMAQLTAAVLSNQRPDLKVLDDAEGASPPSAELEEFKVIVNACWRPKARIRPTAAQLHEAMADLLRRVAEKAAATQR